MNLLRLEMKRKSLVAGFALVKPVVCFLSGLRKYNREFGVTVRTDLYSASLPLQNLDISLKVPKEQDILRDFLSVFPEQANNKSNCGNSNNPLVPLNNEIKKGHLIPPGKVCLGSVASCLRKGLPLKASVYASISMGSGK